VSRSERRRFVEKEQLGPAARLHHFAVPSAELRPAGDPAPHLPRSDDAARLVVQHPAIPGQQAAAGPGDQLAGRRDTVLKRHAWPVAVHAFRRSVRGCFGPVGRSFARASGADAPAVDEGVEKRTLGNSDLTITRLGFGAWAIGGAGWQFGWGPQDDAESIAAIRRAVDRGINWIDTAAAYGLGHSEEVVARALAGIPDAERPYVFTKCALVADGAGRMSESLDPASLRRECEASLRRLRVEAIDLYQVHWPTDRVEDIDAGWAELADLQREGKVRWIGVSNFSLAELERARAIAAVTSLQPPYSLLRRDVETQLLPYARANGIGVIVYSPMQSGLLTGAMTRERAAALPQSDWRSRNPEFREPKLSANLALVERLRAVGARYGASPGEVAIAWTLHDRAVTGAIVGARTADQVDGWAGAARLQLSGDDLIQIEDGVAV
jgi:aryl-alcohol dehydrogenase-like predicted oxidoreductase